MRGLLRRLFGRPCRPGWHAPLVDVRLPAHDCDAPGCVGTHPGRRCPACGYTWDVLADTTEAAL